MDAHLHLASDVVARLVEDLAVDLNHGVGRALRLALLALALARLARMVAAIDGGGLGEHDAGRLAHPIQVGIRVQPLRIKPPLLLSEDALREGTLRGLRAQKPRARECLGAAGRGGVAFEVEPREQQRVRADWQRRVLELARHLEQVVAPHPQEGLTARLFVDSLLRPRRWLDRALTAGALNGRRHRRRHLSAHLCTVRHERVR